MKSYFYALHYLNVTLEDIILDWVDKKECSESIPSLRMRLAYLIIFSKAC